MSRLFDAYIFVDWSAASQPTKVNECPDATWIGEIQANASVAETTYRRTRSDAIAYVKERLELHVDQRRRVLVGLDFPYGYPRGTARALGSRAETPWLRLWQLIADSIDEGPRNANNRWQVAADLNDRISQGKPGPFWGCPPRWASSTLTSSRKGIFDYPYPTESGDLERQRLTEKVLPGTQEVWKLLYKGSVGGQTLVGIPHVHGLRFDPAFKEHSLVWPFETGFSTKSLIDDRRPLIVHTEIWPGTVEAAVRAHQAGRIRDQVQVEQLCLWAAREDTAGRLGRFFEPPQHLSEHERRHCVAEEGWIFGARKNRAQPR